MIDTYFKPLPRVLLQRRRARRDEDGYYWITGRVDDVINVSGHRIGTAEVESALVLHDAVAEAAVVGCPHDVKGQAIYAFVTLDGRQSAQRGATTGIAGPGRQGDRQLRHAGSPAMGAQPAEDPLRQDHAAYPAQDRLQRAGQSRRYLDPGRSGSGAGVDRQPPQPLTPRNRPAALRRGTVPVSGAWVKLVPALS
ncbi:AMP-binding enzyme [Pseudomonas aeruginosa]